MADSILNLGRIYHLYDVTRLSIMIRHNWGCIGQLSPLFLSLQTLYIMLYKYHCSVINDYIYFKDPIDEG